MHRCRLVVHLALWLSAAQLRRALCAFAYMFSSPLASSTGVGHRLEKAN